MWCINFNSGGDNTEHVIYDGNWHIGDAVIARLGVMNIHETVLSIDSTKIDSLWYKVFHFAFFDVIEGVGTTCGPGFAALPYSFEDSWTLNCFIHNNSTPKLVPRIGYFDNDTSCTLATNNIIKNTPKLVIAPNPAVDMVNITIASSMTGTISIIDVTGRVMYNYVLKTTDAKLTIPVSSYAPGMYFVTYRNDAGAQQSSKLIIK